MLSVPSEIEIRSRQINRLTDEAGHELRGPQQQHVARHKRKQLTVEVNNLPELAVAETDGGRIPPMKRRPDRERIHPVWKESKTALAMRMTSDSHDATLSNDGRLRPYR